MSGKYFFSQIVTWSHQGGRLFVSDGEDKLDLSDLFTPYDEIKIVVDALLSPGTDGDYAFVISHDVELVEVRPWFVDPGLRSARPMKQQKVLA
jgi:hypothetical protein